MKLPSDESPEVRITRTRSWLPYSIALWIVAVVVGHGIVYQWLPFASRRPGSTPNVETASIGVLEQKLAATPAPLSAPVPLPIPVASKLSDERSAAADPAQLPSCESVREESQEPVEPGAVLPVNLSRTPLGNLLDYRSWTARCRGPRATRVHLCLAVKNGNILGATARAEPSDTALERCIVRAALRVSLEPEGFLRKVQLDIDLPPERAR